MLSRLRLFVTMCRNMTYSYIIFSLKMLIVFALIILPHKYAFAEVKHFNHIIRQSFSDSQSPDDARIAAIARAKREVLEKAGTYLEKLTLVKNYVIEKQEILALSAGVLNVEVLSEKRFHTNDVFGIEIEVKVDIDSSTLENELSALTRGLTYLPHAPLFLDCTLGNRERA